MHIEFLVEEFSAQAALQNLLPKILSAEITFDIHAFRGKDDLLGKLPARLQGYKPWMPSDYRIVVLVDRDRRDCRELKNKLEAIAAESGFITKTAASNQPFQLLNRIAIEELEAWFLGDVEALCAAYSGVPTSLAQQARYRNPDSVTGGTWEALEQVLQRAGHHRGGLEKVRAARDISQYMNPETNRSPSFQILQSGLLAMLASEAS